MTTTEQVLFDFESGDYGGWEVEGGAFGAAPLAAAEVRAWREDRRPEGYEGRFLVATGGTRHASVPDGRLLSRPFPVTRPYLNFRLGGELHPRVRVCLYLDGASEPARVAYGNNSYHLRRRGWDVRDLMGRTVRLAVEDRAAEASLLRADYFCLSDEPAPPVWADGQGDPEQERGLARPGEFVPAFIAPPGVILHHSCVLRGHDGRWHLYATADSDRYGHGDRLLHAAADRITGPYELVQEASLSPDPAAGEPFVRDPFVLLHGGTYYLYYVGSGDPWEGWEKNTQGPYGVHLATSRDGLAWERHGPALFTDDPFAFTPYVARTGPDEWSLYYAATEPAHRDGRHGIFRRMSRDLVNWGDREAVFLRSAETPWIEHSFCHSPVVFERDSVWHLMCGPLGNRNAARFHYRVLFGSDRPDRWESDTDERSPLGGLFLEGGEKVLRDEAGAWWVTHSGPYAGGLWVAPLHWTDEKGDTE